MRRPEIERGKISHPLSSRPYDDSPDSCDPEPEGRDHCQFVWAAEGPWHVCCLYDCVVIIVFADCNVVAVVYTAFGVTTSLFVQRRLKRVLSGSIVLFLVHGIIGLLR